MPVLTLMSRAKEMLQRRVGTSALIIVPLALAVPAHANTVFNLGSNYITSSSGGAFGGGPFGNAFSALSPDGTAIQFTGDTFANRPTGSYLTADQAFNSLDGSLVTGTNDTATIIFQWGGTFASSDSNGPPDALWLTTNIAPLISPNNGGGSVTWSLDANITDTDGDYIVDESVSSSDSGNSFVQPFSMTGTPDSWSVQLALLWTFPTNSAGTGALYPTDELNVSPTIDMTILSGGQSLPAVPLPPAVWTGSSFLGLLLTVTSLRKLRLRSAT